MTQPFLASVFATWANTVEALASAIGTTRLAIFAALMLAGAVSALASNATRKATLLHTQQGRRRPLFEGSDSTSNMVKLRSARRKVNATSMVVVGLSALALLSTMLVAATSRGQMHEPLWTITQDAQPTYGLRVPLKVCANKLATNPGGLQGAPLTATAHYISSTECSMIVDQSSRRTGAVGVAVLDYATNQVKPACKFENTPAVQGLFDNSLKQDLYEQHRGIVLKQDELYGVCVDGKAKAYWPAMRHVGNPAPITVHGGLFEIDTDGTVTYHESGAVGEFPGPVYPEALVPDTLKHHRFAGTTWFRRNGLVCKQGNVMYERPTSLMLDNVAEFTLYRADDPSVAEYVTPMQRCGKSAAVVGVARVAATSFTAGQLNPVTFHQYNDDALWAPIEELAGNVDASHPEVANSDKIRVHEITPTADGVWTAYVGNDVAVSYRIELKRDGSSKLINVTRERDGGVAPGAYVDGQSDDEGSEQVTDLQQMSTGQLQRLRDELFAELDARLSTES